MVLTTTRSRLSTTSGISLFCLLSCLKVSCSKIRDGGGPGGDVDGHARPRHIHLQHEGAWEADWVTLQVPRQSAGGWTGIVLIRHDISSLCDQCYYLPVD